MVVLEKAVQEADRLVGNKPRVLRCDELCPWLALVSAKYVVENRVELDVVLVDERK